ncbi:MAG: META domain-containing protein [Chitinophagaceae bacterium]|nr:META domain-containing protein [Chitinophagaceae bacterium]MCW5927648.1 META domain-containing protein [Chitinophagaceae bacterium]
MKKVISIFMVTVLLACNSQKTQTVAAGDNSRNALDWAGIYTGAIVSGADSGQLVLQLNSDNTYVLERSIKGKRTEESKGGFEWNSEGSAVTIDGVSYRVGENRLDVLENADKSSATLTKLDNPLLEKYWKLTEVFGNPVTTPEGQREAYVIFKSFDNRYQGNGGCNGYSGAYELLPNGRIKLNPAISTQMACAGLDTEVKLYEVFSKADTYIVTGDTLVLTKARMAPMARFEAVYLR